MSAVAEFYNPERWGDLWGVTRLVNGKWTNPHRGHDIKAAPGEVVPALRAGRVVFSGNTGTTFLGYHTIVDTGEGFDYYCHLLVGTRPEVGTWLEVGASVGVVAGWGDFTGRSWTGPHVHYGSGPNIRSVYEGTTYNATTIVRNALTAIRPATGETIEEIDMPLTDAEWNRLEKLIDGVHLNNAGRAAIAQAVWSHTYTNPLTGNHASAAEHQREQIRRLDALQNRPHAVTGGGVTDEHIETLVEAVENAVANALRAGQNTPEAIAKAVRKELAAGLAG